MIPTGCSTDNDGNATLETLIGGILGDVEFSVSKAEAIPTAATGNVYKLLGNVKKDNRIMELKGFFDPKTESFSISGSLNDLGFEFLGRIGDGKGKAKTKTKDSKGAWVVNKLDFNINKSLSIMGTAEPEAQGLPEEFCGRWVWAKAQNAQLCEQWGTMQSYTGYEDADGNPIITGYMAIAPNSMSFWFDEEEIVKLWEHIAEEQIKDGWLEPEDKAEYITSNIENDTEIARKRSGVYTILEVKDNKDGTYETIVQYLDPENDPDLNPDLDPSLDIPPCYRKVLFQKVGSELRIVLVSSGPDEYYGPDDPPNNWFPNAEDIEEARGFDFVYDDREDWEEGKNYMMIVATRPK